MIYEYRVYRCLPGRLPALLKRFETPTTKIWEKHGIKQAGFWTVLIGDGNHDLHYFIAWESLADREKKWATFQADPAWISARAESERDGPIVANITSTAADADRVLVGEVKAQRGQTPCLEPMVLRSRGGGKGSDPAGLGRPQCTLRQMRRLAKPSSTAVMSR